MRQTHRRSKVVVVVVVVALAALVALAGVAVARQTGVRLRGHAPVRQTDFVTVMVQLQQQPTAVVYAQRLHQGPQAKAGASAAAVSHLAVVHAEQQAFAGRLAAARIPGVKEVYRLQRAYNGFALVVPKSQLAALRAIPGVKGIFPMTPKRLALTHSVPFIGVPGIWHDLGVELHGENMRVGIIDTGVDYIHVNLGGTGDYTPNVSNEVIETDTFPTTKVVGGWDFAGTNYDPDDPATAVPVPDPDPMDVYGHGTHVSGIVAGYGVTKDDPPATYAGPYDATIDESALSIGPGVAPKADLYALKVFGDVAGNTNLVAQAIEWALDPHQDGSFTDALHVVNLSLGSDYGTSFDPEDEVYRNATAAGLVVVAAAGNSNDSFFIAANPGSIPEVISVAASVADGLTYSTLAMLSPATGSFPIAPSTPAPPFGPAFTPAGVGGPLAWLQTDACAPLPPGSLAGKVALLTDLTSCYYFADIIRGVQNAGAIAAVVVAWNDLAPFSMGYWDGPPITIPSGMIWRSDGIALVNAIAAAGGTDVVVNLSSNVISGANEADTLAYFSSRGPTRIGSDVLLKPDIAAPGHMIFSSVAGYGAGGEAWSGTSMATPHIAGVMALLKQYRTGWTVAELKAVAMNTATHDLRITPSGPYVSPARVGSGRVDVPQALAATVIAYDQAAPAAVSLSFKTKDVTEVTSETRTIELKPMDANAVTYDVEYVPAVDASATGVTITLGAATVSVPASGTATLAVTLNADPALMVRTNDGTLGADVALDYRYWMSEVSGYVVFTPQGTTGEPPLRVPVYAAVRPAAAMHATATSVDTTGAVGTETITLAGTGVTPAAAPPIGVVSMVTPFQLAYKSPDEDPIGMPWLPPGYDQTRSNEGDIKTVGITTDWVISDPANVIGLVAVETHGAWGSPGNVDVHVYVKRTSAPGFQYEVYNKNYYGDQILWALRDLATGDEFPWFWFTIGAPYQGDLPVFMTDAMIVPLPFHSLGLSDGDSEIEYVVASNLYMGFPIDQTPLLRYDMLQPGLGFAPGDMWMMYQDQPDKTIGLAYDLEKAFMQRSGGVLLLHHHNANGARGEILTVDGLTCSIDAECPPTRDTRVCDPYQGACVGCLDATACLPGEWCDVSWTRVCMSDCRDAGANPCAPGNYCDLATGACVADCRWQGALPCAAGTWCSTVSGLCVMANALVKQTPELPGTHCPTGGIKIETGIDDNGNGVLDDGPPTEVDQTSYVCNGLPTLVKAVDIPPGTGPCANGGQIIYAGVDDNADHVLQESEYDTFWYACNGLDGHNSILKITDEAPGDNCAAGGKKVETGIDDNGDGVLQAGEVDHLEYVCNGVGGSDGKPALVSITDEAAGDNCPAGGKKVEAGIDANGNGVLDAAEVDQTSYICNGSDGATGSDGTPGGQSLVETTALASGADCAAGGILVKTGLDANGNGKLDADEITSVTAVCTGAKGKGCSASPSASGATPLAFLLLLGLFLARRRP